MLAKSYDRGFAERCFSQIEGFGTYGFPESHAASFALLVYCSAWLKCYYPDVFAAAILNSQPMGFYAPAQLVRDAREHGVEVRPVDVNASDWDHTLEPLAASEKTPSPPEKPPSSCPSPAISPWRDCRLEWPYPPADMAGEKGRCGTLPSWSEGGLHAQGKEAVCKTTHAVRLGFRLVAGFREDDAKCVIEARQQDGRFRTPEDLMHRAKLGPAAMRTLARADAFGSLDLGRRATLWHVSGLEPDNLPLLPSPSGRGNAIATGTPCAPSYGEGVGVRGDVELPPLRDEEAVTEDYSVFGLSLRNHPMAFMRTGLQEKGMVTAADLKKLPDGRFIKIAGLVLFRQRPGTAKGTIFMTIEDETGAANLIVWPKLAEKYRRAVFGAKVLLCEGVLQKESNVIHVVSRRLTDWTAALQRLQPQTTEAFALRFGRGDEVAHASGSDAQTRKSVNQAWTDTLKSRDFR
jgi:error-prone DNA polymerase